MHFTNSKIHQVYHELSFPVWFENFLSVSVVICLEVQSLYKHHRRWRNLVTLSFIPIPSILKPASPQVTSFTTASMITTSYHSLYYTNPPFIPYLATATRATMTSKPYRSIPCLGQPHLQKIDVQV